MYIVRDRYHCVRHRTEFRSVALIVAETIPGACVWLEV
jgi:hypothetical protein